MAALVYNPATGGVGVVATVTSGGGGGSGPQQGVVAAAYNLGGDSLATGQVAVTTSATLVVAARAGRQKVSITSTSAVVFYVGGPGVTAANGHYVAGTAGATITLDTAAAVYAVGAGAVTLSYIELC